MSFIICGNCKNLLKFFTPESKDNKFWCRCGTCGAVNDLALDTMASGERKPVFKVIGVRNQQKDTCDGKQALKSKPCHRR